MLLAPDAAALGLKGSVRLNVATEPLTSGRRILSPAPSFLCELRCCLRQCPSPLRSRNPGGLAEAQKSVEGNCQARGLHGTVTVLLVQTVTACTVPVPVLRAVGGAPSPRCWGSPGAQRADCRSQGHTALGARVPSLALSHIHGRPAERAQPG